MLLAVAALLMLPAASSSASTAAAGSGGPNIAAPDDYATLLDREQAAFDAAEFTPATADKDAPPPDVGFGSTRNPQLRRRALVPVAGARRAVDRHRRRRPGDDVQQREECGAGAPAPRGPDRGLRPQSLRAARPDLGV